MRRLQWAALVAAGAGAQTVLLSTRFHRLGAAGRAAGVISAAVVHTAVAVGLRRAGGRVGPADAVTLVRATIGCTIAGLVVDAGVRSAPATGTESGARGPSGILPLSTAALLLDAADGAVARRTGTESAFGARFDGEVDAFLIAILSLHAARTHGPWVLLAGLARYGFWAAGTLAPWLRRPLPPRPWRKVAAATEGIALTATNAAFLPRSARTAGVAAGSVLIAESFGRDVWWLWRRRIGPG